jgi:rubrerythrin
MAADEESELVDDPTPPEDFKEVDENIETEHSCPKCGYKWSGGK